MKIKGPGLFITPAVASVVVVSAAAAIYVSAVSQTAASTTVTPLDLSSSRVVQAAMEFDPFASGNVVPEADLRPEGGDAPLASVDRQPTDPPATAAENTPKVESSGEKAPADAAADKAKAAGSKQATAQKGAIDAAKTGSKMKFGLGAAVAGVAAAGAGVMTLNVALSDDSKTVIRSPSTP